MRLIDAEELKEVISEEVTRKFVRWDKTITVSEWETFIQDIIDNAPSVSKITKEKLSIAYDQGYEDGKNDWLQEERPQGEWTQSDIDGQFYCSACGEQSICHLLNEPAPIFCPNCGAKMRTDAD